MADPTSSIFTQVVYTRRWINKTEDRWDSALWIMDVDGGRNRFFAKGASPVGSPDGTRVAYVAEGEPKGAHIFVRWIDRDGPPTQLTRDPTAPSNLHWSPDGKGIGFVRFVPQPTPWNVEMPASDEGAKVTPAPRITERLHYRADRAGYLDPGVQQIFVVAADGSTPRAITPASLLIGAQFDAIPTGVTWDWAPDGRLCQRLRHAPIQRQLAARHRAAVFDDLLNARVQREILRHGGQRYRQFLQALQRHGGICWHIPWNIALKWCPVDEIYIRLRLARFTRRGQDGIAPLVHRLAVIRDHRLGFAGLDYALFGKTLRIQRARAAVLADETIHERLRDQRLVLSLCPSLRKHTRSITTSLLNFILKSSAIPVTSNTASGHCRMRYNAHINFRTYLRVG